VPGAFTPTCHRNHLPGYVQKKDEIKAKGVDSILVTSVNDVFVLEAWGKASGAEGIEFLSDGNADFAKAIGLSMDGSGFGLGTRSQRYSMVVEDGVVKAINVEDAPSKAQHSGADNIMKDL
jgi:glutaredoxin/glutathione-dependent peroxiredoxin